VRLFSSMQLRIPSICLLALALAGCQRQVKSELSTPSPTPLPQDTFVQAYFNQEPTSKYTDPYRNLTRLGDDLEQKIVEAIVSAQSTVDVAVQELRLPRIAQALVDRHKAGVKVRVIIENIYARSYSSYTDTEVEKLPKRERDRYADSLRLIDLNGDGQLSQSEIDQRDALAILLKAKIPLINDSADGSKGSDLMHHKFVIVDGQRLVVTSANFTMSDVHGDLSRPASRGNANSLLNIESSQLATLFTEEFNLMWGDGPGGKPDSKFGLQKLPRPPRSMTIGDTLITVHFSPTSSKLPWSQSSNGLIGKTLSSGTQAIDMALFVFSDQTLVDLLETSHLQGVKIRALIDPGFMYRSYSEGLDMLGVSLVDSVSAKKGKCKYEAQNRPWTSPMTTVGVPRLPPGDLLHHKFGLVDAKTAIMGSHNWTTAANTGNDETLLVVQNPIVAAHYQREFERLYTNAILGLPPAIQRKVDAQQKQCKSAGL